MKISSLYDDEGREITDESEILNLVDHHFSTVGKKMANEVPYSNINPISYVRHDKASSFFMSPTSIDEIVKLIDWS